MTEEWYELHLAAWLHDCGKVTTPEFVVDKATKLETIYNRIHEVRARFEILRRDAEIECLKGKLAGGDPAELDAAFEAECRQLEADFAFVAESNLGGEFFTDDNLIAAASMYVAAPTLIVYFALQKHFIAGLSLGADKG